MGGASSLFAETDWEVVDGGIADKTQTIDGADPTTKHTILTLRKENVVNQRDFEVRDYDQNDRLIYVSKAVPGTTKWFDFYVVKNEQGDDTDRSEQKLFRVTTNSLRSQWTIYSCTPVFEGQIPDEEGSKEDEAGKTNGQYYRKAQIEIVWNKYHGHVYPIVQPAPGTPQGNSKNDVSSATSKDIQRGVTSKESMLLKVEEINSKTAQYQSFHPNSTSMVEIPHPPLSGWWVWEHTPNRHQMKMHLAKSTDMALHCIVAIATNLVYVEKHAEGE